MVIVDFSDNFEKIFKKIKDQSLKEKIKKHIMKIIQNPEIGKAMMYARKGTREVYTTPYRLSYMYISEENKVVLLDLYHKDKQ
ncbi:TPA: type II toxin-antitoxin system RelE/ParE family toxin [Candidatus Woesearchaeota archaeon]|nr:type II toxin-antitoxin system RelE/ParE family toxin [Candidatus Woesearchaeota archaeon]HIH54197.1 type II toxin-antitoxin system RelE/ParE family toxin [Candidatus Woesearchaeota archaeon]HIJ02017.1 type II toxin-antitoxin system RelE/ParE family toxin [Candidatus Woesearchaeota archaeon]HIJ13909.1 type II toxin-antitoxin system RelE/ParE family toxin [Candidatus Woesearchaeota archaeon]